MGEENFKKAREEWQELVKQSKIEEADQIYWGRMFPYIEQEFIKKTESKEICQYDWLIIPAGLEASYYILLINGLKPKNVYFLCTPLFKERFLDIILEKTKLPSPRYEIGVVEYEGMDVSDIYGKIKNKLDLFAGKEVAVDLTRGKRIISVGAGIIAAFFGFDLIYIDEGWIDEIKRGMPSTEELVQVKNPFKIFGDIEIRFGIELFNKRDFGSAANFFTELCDKVIDPRDCETKALIAETYNHWDGFNYAAALVKLKEALSKIEQYNLKFDANQLKKNLAVLEILSKVKSNDKIDDFLDKDETIIHLLVDMYLNAFRRKERNRLEDAITRFYRLLELVSQYRLAKYEISTSKPVYEAIPALASKFKELTEKVLMTEGINLPAEIGIKGGHLILFALKDEIWKEKTIDDLKRFISTIRSRDNSIIAHGIGLMGGKVFRNLDKLCQEFLEKICLLGSKNLQKLIEEHKFITL